MSADLNDRAHYVYRHYDAKDALLYVGMTSEPTVRPHVTTNRPWLGLSVRCELSPAMTREAAAHAERMGIIEGQPLHNQRATGEWVGDPDDDPRVQRIMGVEDVSRTIALRYVAYYPTDLGEFEALMQSRIAYLLDKAAS